MERTCLYADIQTVSSTPASANPLRVLLVEDSPEDAELLVEELSRGGYHVIVERVDTAAGMRDALKGQQWHVVVSDYSMPGFGAPEALAVLREVSPELPFIIVSGTVDEEIAVASMKAGACDFLVKGKLARLVPALERELREVGLRTARENERQALVMCEALCVWSGDDGDDIFEVVPNDYVLPPDWEP